MKKIKKADSQKFNELIMAMLLGIGCLHDDTDNRDRYVLATIGGTLAFTIDNTTGERQAHIHCYTLFSRFSDPVLAVKELGDRNVNRYSGKWNHHLTGAQTPEEAVDEIRKAVDRVTVVRKH
jgi:hypothetical protein